MSEPPNRPIARFFGGLLMAVGGLIAVTAGLCSLSFVVIDIWQRFAYQRSGFAATPTELTIVMIFGGIPFAVGAGLFLGGRALWRGPRPNIDPHKN